MIRIEKVILLEREDLIESSLNKEIKHLSTTDFRISLRDASKSELILYKDGNFTRVLTSRWF